jgi:hypothetical protein
MKKNRKRIVEEELYIKRMAKSNHPYVQFVSSNRKSNKSYSLVCRIYYDYKQGKFIELGLLKNPHYYLGDVLRVTGFDDLSTCYNRIYMGKVTDRIHFLKKIRHLLLCIRQADRKKERILALERKQDDYGYRRGSYRFSLGHDSSGPNCRMNLNSKKVYSYFTIKLDDSIYPAQGRHILIDLSSI